MSIYPDKSRPKQWVLTTRLNEDVDHYLIETMTALTEKTMQEADVSSSHATRMVLKTVLEFYMTNGQTSPDITEPYERLRRVIDDHHGLTLELLGRVLDKINDIQVVSTDSINIDADDETEMMDAPDFLKKHFLSNLLDRTGESR